VLTEVPDCLAAIQYRTASGACANCPPGTYAEKLTSTACVAALPMSFAFGNDYDTAFPSLSPSTVNFVRKVRARVAAVIGWAAAFVLEAQASRGSIVMQMLVPDSESRDL
jgi:hypothetical protein